MLKSLPGDLLMLDLAAVRNEVAPASDYIALAEGGRKL
ncbi:hypothetical protein CT19425_U350073 [Cupriavidus taiwanensis]|uniref:Uncharacterized protein n=2 Tax=Cupriavidus taiwanensis TaxID=164546 RepID=A0A375I5N8_9BURK|nr:hypothetical protein CT19425_U350073 [Cupriavidus taiwanensis]